MNDRINIAKAYIQNCLSSFWSVALCYSINTSKRLRCFHKVIHISHRKRRTSQCDGPIFDPNMREHESAHGFNACSVRSARPSSNYHLLIAIKFTHQFSQQQRAKIICKYIDYLSILKARYQMTEKWFMTKCGCCYNNMPCSLDHFGNIR